MSNYVFRAFAEGDYGDIVVMYPKVVPNYGSAPIAIVHHPHLSSATAISDPRTSKGFYRHMEYLARHGYVTVAGDFRKLGPTGNTAQWGNNHNQAGIQDARAWGVKFGGSPTKKMLLVGFSMGTAVTLGYAGRFPQDVAGVFAVLPAIDIWLYKNPGPDGPFDFDGVTPYSFANTIDAAYDGGYSNAAYGDNHNPRIQAAQGKFANMPIQLWYGDKDTFAPRALVRRFYDVIKEHNPNAPVVIQRIPAKNVVHDEPAAEHVPMERLLAFARSCVT